MGKIQKQRKFVEGQRKLNKMKNELFEKHIPVNEVRKDSSGAEKVRVLYRNLLLSLSITLDKSK